MKYITVKIFVNEDYEDTHPEIILADFLDNPKVWEVDLITDDRKDTPGHE